MRGLTSMPRHGDEDMFQAAIGVRVRSGSACRGRALSWERRGVAAPRRLAADDVMTGREVARLLHAPVSTVEDWARRGILPSVKIGRRRLYIREQIEAVLTNQAGSRIT
jgi:excisionase family DNA binding protein